MTVRTLWTYEDYAALPDDGRRYEIYDGELCELTSPNAIHQIEALGLRDGEYAVVARVSGEQPVDLPPFTDLGLVPASLWPEEFPAE